MVTQASKPRDTFPRQCPSPVCGPRQQAWFRALDHARLTGAKPVYSIATDSYRVTSPRAGDTYHVHPTDVDGLLTYHCDCPAGMNGRVCWHAALVAALPGEIRRRRTYNARSYAGRVAARTRVTPSTAEEIAETRHLMAQTTAALISGVAPSLSDIFA